MSKNCWLVRGLTTLYSSTLDVGRTRIRVAPRHLPLLCRLKDHHHHRAVCTVRRTTLLPPVDLYPTLRLERRCYEVAVIALTASRKIIYPEIAVLTPDARVAVEDTTLRYVRRKGIQETSLQQIRPLNLIQVRQHSLQLQRPAPSAQCQGEQSCCRQLIRWPTTPLGQG